MPKKNHSRLNAKQVKFAAEYIKDFNATQAAVRAGYSLKTAGAQGHHLLKNQEIQAKLAEHIRATESEAVLTLQEAREILSEICRAKVGDYFDANGLINFDRLREVRPHALSSIRQLQDGKGSPVVQIRLHDKITAIERLAKLSGWDAPEKIDAAVTFGIDLPPDFPEAETQEPDAHVGSDTD